MAVSRPGASLPTSHGQTRVELPPDVTWPFEVYVNDVLQRPRENFQIHGSTLVFDRPLRNEGRLGLWRWASLLLGIAGTYRQNDTVDVVYEREGRRIVAAALPIAAEAAGGASSAP